MKKIFTLVLSMVFGLSLWAQSINVTPNTFEKVIKESDKAIFNMTVSNLSDNTVKLYWKLIKSSDIPAAWETQVCDGNLCYGFNADACSPKRGNLIEPQGTVSGLWSLKVDPKSVKGSGKIYMEFYTDSLFTNKIYSTDQNAVFVADAVLGTGRDLNTSSLAIYPNPTVNFFSIKGDNNVSKVSLVNIIGREVWTKNHTKGAAYDVSDLAKGMYVVRMFDDRGRNIKTIRLNKATL